MNFIVETPRETLVLTCFTLQCKKRHPRGCSHICIWPFPETQPPGLFRPAVLHRLLAHTLVEALWDQLLLDVSGGGGVFTLGDTSRLIGTTVAAAVSDSLCCSAGKRLPGLICRFPHYCRLLML